MKIKLVILGLFFTVNIFQASQGGEPGLSKALKAYIAGNNIAKKPHVDAMKQVDALRLEGCNSEQITAEMLKRSAAGTKCSALSSTVVGPTSLGQGALRKPLTPHRPVHDEVKSHIPQITVPKPEVSPVPIVVEEKGRPLGGLSGLTVQQGQRPATRAETYSTVPKREKSVASGPAKHRPQARLVNFQEMGFDQYCIQDIFNGGSDGKGFKGLQNLSVQDQQVLERNGKQLWTICGCCHCKRAM